MAASEDWVVGVDLGATKIALGLLRPDGGIAARRRMDTAAHRGPQDVVDRIAGSINSLREELPDGAQIAALGVCSPGPIDHRTGTLIDPPNLGRLHGAPLRDMLVDRLGIPVHLEHDAKAAALGEYHYGAGRGEPSMVYIVVGTGVGAAIILDGQLYRGGSNSAGEVGHITLDRQGEVCSCGSRGCVETYASGPWLGRRYDRARRRAGQGGATSRPTSGEQVAEKARLGDELAQHVMAQAGEALGVAIASMAMILDVELYVVGGGVAGAADLILEPARETIPHCSYGSVCCRVRIVASELGDDAPILGCGWLAQRLPVQNG
jgi:glucokinase